MPHIPLERKKLLRKDPKAANCEGDYNFLYTVAYLTHWLKEGNQCYAQIHKIRKASIQPLTIDEVSRVETTLTVVPMLDRIVARDLALREFERLVVSLYEEHCVYKNGIVEEYEIARNKIHTIDNALITKRVKERLSKETK